MNVQLIPPSDSLIPTMPSGREVHTSKAYIPPPLDEDIMIQMRAPPDESELIRDASRGSDSDDEDGRSQAPAGAFPGTKGEYGSDRTYY